MGTKALKLSVDPNSNPHTIQNIDPSSLAIIALNDDGSGEIQFTVRFSRGIGVIDIPEEGLPTAREEGYFPLQVGSENTISDILCTDAVVSFASQMENTTINLEFKLRGKQGGLGNGTTYGKQGTNTLDDRPF